MRLATEGERNWVRSVLAVTEADPGGVSFVPHSSLISLCSHFLESDGILRVAVEAVTVMDVEIQRLRAELDEIKRNPGPPPGRWQQKWQR